MREGAEIVSLSPKHAAITPHIRRSDAEEIWAAEGVAPKLAIASSIAATEIGWAAELYGTPVAIFGVCRSGEDSGFVWLIATDVIEKYPVHFYRVSKGVIAELKKRFDYLENWVDARNKLSLRWLKWAGFTVSAPGPWGAFAMDFCHIWWRRD